MSGSLQRAGLAVPDVGYAFQQLGLASLAAIAKPDNKAV
jgi:hypothetical protein